MMISHERGFKETAQTARYVTTAVWRTPWLGNRLMPGNWLARCLMWFKGEVAILLKLVCPLKMCCGKKLMSVFHQVAVDYFKRKLVWIGLRSLSEGCLEWSGKEAPDGCRDH